MNFLNLHYFLVTAEEMSITRAAKRLFISQQALSAHISNLEKEYGVRLFDRSPAFSLTYAGKRFLQAAREMSDIRRRLDGEMDEIRGELRGELRIGTSYSRGQALLPYVLPRFLKKHPSIEILLREATSEVLLGMLEKGEIDIILTADNAIPETADAVPLARERVLLAVPRPFFTELFGPDAAAAEKRLEDGTELAPFMRFPFILLRHGDRVRSMMDNAFARERLTPRILLETQNIQTAFALACEGMGITVYPEMFLFSTYTRFPDLRRDSVLLFPIRGLPPQTLYAGFRRSHVQTAGESAFLRELLSLTREEPFVRLEAPSA